MTDFNRGGDFEEYVSFNHSKILYDYLGQDPKVLIYPCR